VKLAHGLGDMRQLFVIGIGTGDPDHITVQGIKALARAQVVFLLDKGRDKAALGDLRRTICERHLPGGAPRFVEIEHGPRAAGTPSYTAAVEEWHEQRLLAYEQAFVRELAEHGTGAILVWGDPALYDSTLRILRRMSERAQVAFEYEVVPGISSPQVLAARHKLALNQIGGAVHVTTGRRLAQGWPADADDVLVMLDGECTFRQLDEPGLEIYWGAYLGSEHELLRAGPLAELKDEIARVRAVARSQHGWIMDTYLLRRGPR
jgi:precorrin-6A synthase